MATFAIIGTRQPDLYQAELATTLARTLSSAGHAIRTGGADGIDTCAMKGTCEHCLEVVLPWKGYNALIIPKHARVLIYDPAIHLEWTKSVALYHPAADRLTRGPFALHARNYGILWPDPKTHVKRVIALPGPDGGGGTGQGIRIARGMNIPLTQINRGAMKSQQDLTSAVNTILRACLS